MSKSILEIMEEARQAQQKNEQKHDVQLEVSGWLETTPSDESQQGDETR